MIAVCLQHHYNIDTQGSDALDQDNRPVEYKCIKKGARGYSGSFQFHWLSAEKMAKYRACDAFYFAWRDGFRIDKIVKVKTEVLLPQIGAKANPTGGTKGHKSFGHRYIDELVNTGQATIEYGR